jgi:FkbM family methyltransferase
MADVPFSMIVPTVYGQMIVNRHDINQTNALVKTGRAIDHEEIVLLRRCLELRGGHRSVIDVGANFGTYTLGLARDILPDGKVYAFEPQRIICNMLAGSVALNALRNVHCFNMAVADRQGTIEIPQYDYDRPLNFGSIEFGATQQEALSQERVYDPATAEQVPLVTLDQLQLPRIGLIKIDAERMEGAVLTGAVATIAQWRPLLYVEYLKNDVEALRRQIGALGYDTYSNVQNYLCIPHEERERILVEGR